MPKSVFILVNKLVSSTFQYQAILTLTPRVLQILGRRSLPNTLPPKSAGPFHGSGPEGEGEANLSSQQGASLQPSYRGIRAGTLHWEEPESPAAVSLGTQGRFKPQVLQPLSDSDSPGWRQTVTEGDRGAGEGAGRRGGKEIQRNDLTIKEVKLWVAVA